MEVEVTTVYGASKYEQKITEAPSSVTVITSEEIRKYGYHTLADVLKSVRGFYVTNDRNYSYVGVQRSPCKGLKTKKRRLRKARSLCWTMKILSEKA